MFYIIPTIKTLANITNVKKIDIRKIESSKIQNLIFKLKIQNLIFKLIYIMIFLILIILLLSSIDTNNYDNQYE